MSLVKKSHLLTLRDRLSQLNLVRAIKLLGPQGKQLIIKGGKEYDLDFSERLDFQHDTFRLRFEGEEGPPIVTISLRPDALDRLHCTCSVCKTSCIHLGATLASILERKMELGLSELPPDRVPIESLSEAELIERAMSERAERAKAEKMRIASADAKSPWTDYVVTSAVSGKSYRVALRGLERGQAYCTCPDFRVNTLGSCKHIIKVIARVSRKFTPAQLRRPFRPKQVAVYLQYGEELSLRFELPNNLDDAANSIIGKFSTTPIENIPELMRRISRLEAIGVAVTIYPDAEEFIQQRLFQQRIATRVQEIRSAVSKHELRKSLLKVDLLPYQLDGIAFAVGAGRAILADDMGLGKTIQGIGVAELLAREADIGKVLVVCPASLKSQWRNEIHRFCSRTVQTIGGSSADRLSQYDSDNFFTICNYEQVLRDIDSIEKVKWDLIILDEGQRIKNWQAKTSNVIKSLRSPFALVLSGTPLENRLEELYSVAQFIDDRRLGPAFRFFNRHRTIDEKGKLLGYKNLDVLRESMRPFLLRRTRESVRLQLPPRTTEIVRIPATEEQMVIHAANMRTVAAIVRKRYISEMDLLRLRQALLACRMVANSTFLVNKEEPAYSTKLAHFNELVERLFEEPDRKVVVFSEWTTMLNLIERILKQHGLRYVRLDGSVPQHRRQQLVHEFQTNPDCQLFLTTNAGSTGLNLQAANTVINVDLPWNPAVLEQRIARAHRMGQTQPVQVYILITEGTIEEQLLATLSAKKGLALAALDIESEVREVDLRGNSGDLKQRLEVLLGAKPEALEDVSKKQAATSDAELASRRERVAAAGGELLGAAFQFLGELIASQNPHAKSNESVKVDLKNRLSECVEQDDSGRQKLTITLPTKESLDNLADVLAKLLASSQ